tara:strand:+ start:759 stop:923 length:165 start_codon:yes stop_codon:yes gene_type:complete
VRVTADTRNGVHICEITGVGVAWMMTGKGSMGSKFSPAGRQAAEQAAIWRSSSA